MVSTSTRNGGSAQSAARRRAALKFALSGPLLAALLPATTVAAANADADADANRAASAATPGDDRRLRETLERIRQRPAPAGATEREALLAAGEAALSDGDTESATSSFERAGFVKHAADAELGLIRCYMQDGAYRRALTFAAHTAGAHPDVAAGAALYAWLLHVGGQTRVAVQLLERARARLPDDGDLAGVAALLSASPASASSWSPAAAPTLRDVRVGPYSPPSASLPQRARVVAAATLLQERAHTALAPAAAVRHGQALWLRDGCGRLAAVRVTRVDDELGVVVLELLASMAPAGEVAALADRPPAPGKPAFVVDPSSARHVAAWPRLHVEFFGMPAAAFALKRTAANAHAQCWGAPVFDTAGRVAGISLGDHAASRVVMAATLRTRLLEGKEIAAAQALAGTQRSDPHPAATVAVDEIYERGMRQALQLIAA